MAVVQNARIFIDHLALTQGATVVSERSHGPVLSDPVRNRVSLLEHFVGYTGRLHVVYHGDTEPLLVKASPPAKLHGPSFFEVVDRYGADPDLQRVTISTEPSDRPGHIHVPDGLGLDTIEQALVALGDCPPASLVLKWLSLTPPTRWGQAPDNPNTLFHVEHLRIGFPGPIAGDYPSGLDYECFYRACTLEGWSYFRQTGEWNSYGEPTIYSVELVELSTSSTTVFSSKGYA